MFDVLKRFGGDSSHRGIPSATTAAARCLVCDFRRTTASLRSGTLAFLIGATTAQLRAAQAAAAEAAVAEAKGVMVTARSQSIQPSPAPIDWSFGDTNESDLIWWPDDTTHEAVSVTFSAKLSAAAWLAVAELAAHHIPLRAVLAVASKLAFVWWIDRIPAWRAACDDADSDQRLQLLHIAVRNPQCAEWLLHFLARLRGRAGRIDESVAARDPLYRSAIHSFLAHQIWSPPPAEVGHHLVDDATASAGAVARDPSTGDTVLHALIRHGADVFTPAQWSGCKCLTSLLPRIGEFSAATNRRGETPLQLCTRLRALLPGYSDALAVARLPESISGLVLTFAFGCSNLVILERWHSLLESLERK